MKLNIVPARTGITWVKLGFKTFLQQPLAMSGLFFMFMAAGTALSLIPVVGPILTLMIVPAATLGLMAATREAETGKFPMPAVMLSAFRAGSDKARDMLILGAMYAGICLLIMSVLLPLLADAPVITKPAASPEDAAAAMMTPQFQRYMLVTVLLYLPVSILFWHAPALVHWHRISPVKSLFFSFIACIRNVGALMLFIVGWIALFLAIGLVVTLLGALIGSPTLMQAATYPMALLLMAMFSTSLYFTFSDSFEGTSEGELPSNPTTTGDAS